MYSIVGYVEMNFFWLVCGVTWKKKSIQPLQSRQQFAELAATPLGFGNMGSISHEMKSTLTKSTCHMSNSHKMNSILSTLSLWCVSVLLLFVRSFKVVKSLTRYITVFPRNLTAATFNFEVMFYAVTIRWRVDNECGIYTLDLTTAYMYVPSMCRTLQRSKTMG